MNLVLGDASDLVEFLHLVISRSGKLLASGGRCAAVEMEGRVFYTCRDRTEVGGPFRSLEELVRSQGSRRHRWPEGDTQIEVFEWDGRFYRIGVGDVGVFATLSEAVNRPSAAVDHE